jgi:hypothetical protein
LRGRTGSFGRPRPRDICAQLQMSRRRWRVGSARTIEGHLCRSNTRNARRGRADQPAVVQTVRTRAAERQRVDKRCGLSVKRPQSATVRRCTSVVLTESWPTRRPNAHCTRCLLGLSRHFEWASPNEQGPTGGSSSVGRASAFQAECRGFETRLPLQTSQFTSAATCSLSWKSVLLVPLMAQREQNTQPRLETDGPDNPHSRAVV